MLYLFESKSCLTNHDFILIINSQTIHGIWKDLREMYVINSFVGRGPIPVIGVRSLLLWLRVSYKGSNMSMYIVSTLILGLSNWSIGRQNRIQRFKIIQHKVCKTLDLTLVSQHHPWGCILVWSKGTTRSRTRRTRLVYFYFYSRYYILLLRCSNLVFLFLCHYVGLTVKTGCPIPRSSNIRRILRLHLSIYTNTHRQNNEFFHYSKFSSSHQETSSPPPLTLKVYFIYNFVVFNVHVKFYCWFQLFKRSSFRLPLKTSCLENKNL